MLTSLQSQLAAIKNPAGTTVASNRKHDQAIGRGVNFSVQTGKHGNIESNRFQASLIYESTKEAADVPLSTLKSQYEAALSQLNDSELIAVATRLENASSPKSAKTQLVRLLPLLASILLESRSSESTPVLHCLEYLLRAYQLHMAHPIDLLWTVIAASQHPKLQQRVLELIDWAEHPSYLWMRAYVATGFPSRNIISQFVMKETTILKTLCAWSTGRRCSPKFLSFTAAILIEGLRNLDETREDHIEQMLRILIPAIAPKPTDRNDTSTSTDDEMDLSRWKMIIASTVAEVIPLSQALLDFLCTRIVTSDNSTMHSLACVVSILLARKIPSKISDEKLQYMLEMPSDNGDEVTFIGCPVLSQPIASALWKIDNLAGRLRDLNMLVTPLVASLVLRCEIDESVPVNERNKRIASLLELEPQLVPAFLSTRQLNPESKKGLRDQFQLPLDEKHQTMSYANHASVEWLLAQSPPTWSAVLLRLSSRIGVTSYEKSLIVRTAFANFDSISEETIRALAYCSHEALPILAACCSQPSLEASAKESIRYISQCCDFVEQWMVENSSFILDSQIPADCQGVVRGCIQTIASSLVVSSSRVNAVSKQGLYQVFLGFLLDQTEPLPEAQSEMFRKALSVVFETFSNEEKIRSIVDLSRCSKQIRRTFVAPLIQSTKLKCFDSQADVFEEVMLLECATLGTGRSEWLLSLVTKLPSDVCLVYAIALLKLGNESTKNSVVELLSNHSKNSSTLSQDARQVCMYVSSHKASAKMGGSSFLSNLLTQTSNIDFIASLFVTCALGRLDDTPRNQWLAASSAAIPIAEALELLDQDKFPLLKRWKLTGIPLSQHLGKLPEEIQLYVFRMMKGIVTKKTHLVISTGPSGNGGRARSYSIGSEDVTLLRPYPKSMLDVISVVLTTHETEVAQLLVTTLLNSTTWREKVFSTIDTNGRQTVVVALVTFFCERNSDIEAQGGFYKLFLSAEEIVLLFQKMSGGNGTLSLLVDYVGENAESLSSSTKSFVTIVSSLFDQMAGFRLRESFVLHAMITTLRRLFDAVSSAKQKIDIDKVRLKQWSAILVALFVESTSVYSKLRPGLLSLLLCMCPLSPSQLIEAIDQCVLASLDDSTEMLVSKMLEMILPVYLEHGPTARRPTIDLYASIIERISQKKNYLSFILGISRSLRDLQTINSSTEIVSFMLTLISRCVISGEDYMAACREILSNEINPSKKLRLLCQLLDYVDTMLVGNSSVRYRDIIEEKSDEHEREIKSNCQRLLALPSKTKQQSLSLSLPGAILCMVNDSILDEDAKIVNDVSVGESTPPLLMQIWQKLLPIEFESRRKFSGDETPDRFEEHVILSTLSEIRESLQELLPPRDFWNSIHTILSSAPEPEILGQTFQIFSDRAASIDEMQPEEATLFLGIIPPALECIQRLEAEDDAEGASVVIQAALVSIEQLARACGPNLQQLRINRKTNRETIRMFQNSLERCTKIVQDQNDNVELVCSGALCASTLIRVLQSNSLPSLSTLLTALVSKLTGDDCVGRDFSSALFCVSMLRPMISIVETMPKFISSSLPSTVKVLLSARLRESKDVPVFESLNRLETALLDRVEPRLLLPCLTKLHLVTKDNGNSTVLLHMIHQSAKKASSLCIAGLLTPLVASICLGLEDPNTRNVSIDVLLTIILKMNESQLKNMYVQLRDWSTDNTPSRKVAFWSATCRLAKELRVIFLSCFNLVFPDLLQTLNQFSKDEEPPTKKRRTTNASPLPREAMSPALSSLEYALRADSHQGGIWLRDGGNNDRFESILDCLNSLMRNAPDLDPLKSCITALGLAAGDDVFWKPLNHSVLSVCQLEGNPTCVRLGLGCLLELMKALGEEYLTLLPEILPILAELLEDANEDITRMAREIVTYAESLTGEDLEARLR